MIMQWRKWGGSPHWRHECVYLGSDEWGDWVGQPIGWHSARPGAAMDAECLNVTMIPANGMYALTVNRDHPRGLRVYIDLAWDVHWGAPAGETNPDAAAGFPLLTGIDMDLDVVRRLDNDSGYPVGTAVVDRDEFAEHRVKYGYPTDVVETLEALANELEEVVRDEGEPFDDATADAWLDRLAGLNLPPRLNG